MFQSHHTLVSPVCFLADNDNRVRLSTHGGPIDRDYINASRIEVNHYFLATSIANMQFFLSF